MKPAKLKDLRRRGPVRQVNKTVLIVCEGSKTEPAYLRDMVQDYGIHGVVEVTGECGSAPISVVEKAIDMFEKNGSYDSVYCVFDRDSHTTYDQAVAKVAGYKLERREKGRIVHSAKFVAIPSVPCFEYWILLHYSAAAPPMPVFSDLLPRLKKVGDFSNYEKGMARVYQLLRDLTPTAVVNATTVARNAAASGSLNPMTLMHVLVSDLGALRRR